jgi:hypothetical protein
MTAMDIIYADPIMFTSYRIGVLKQRIDNILSGPRGGSVTVAQIELQLDMYREEVSTLQHLYDILIKNNLK